MLVVSIKGVNSVPYWLVPSEYIIPTSKPVHITLLFRTRKNTGHTGQFRAIPTSTKRTNQKRNLFIYLFFLSFVIFEFLLGQNGNLLVLFIFLVCNGNF